MYRVTYKIILLACIFIAGCRKGSNVTHTLSCDTLITDTLGSNDSARLYIPTAFTPNHDGLNDVFAIHTKNILSYSLVIYEGMPNNIRFSTNDMNLSWTGPPVPIYALSQRYHYILQATTSSNHHIGICGFVDVLSCISGSVALSSYDFEDQLQANGFTGITNESLPACP